MPLGEKKKLLASLQEVVFWQQLNGQLLRSGFRPGDWFSYPARYLRDFCFSTSLFSHISNAEFVSDIPLVLVTNFSDINFLSIGDTKWQSFLMKEIHRLYNIIILDIEQALADTFIVLESYDNNYHLVKKGDGRDDDDDELYGFIQQYLKEKGKRKRDYGKILSSAYELKANCLNSIIKIIGKRYSLDMTFREISLRIIESGLYEKVQILYKEKYCKLAERLVRPFIHGNLEISKILKTQPKRTKSIEEFINY
jgi:hypothetical protein